MNATLTTTDVVDVLRAARELFAQAPSHEHAAVWPSPGTYCPWTACSRAAKNLNSRVGYLCATRALRDVTGREDLAYWNAENSTETVLAAFDAAIEASS